MSRYIDADLLELPYGCCEDATECYKALNALPSIDIVRCGECKYFEPKEDWCYWRDEAITADGFCNYGERKESE